ncbi:mucin-19-like [Contarinia nasturtii]|uniref:mucin-19-like n=1 Tax=Contarinia nasturtii TaxID=265458 RepID=UPI0012D46855|nr:mucin-19-like [Contarinia nasturtii]
MKAFIVVSCLILAVTAKPQGYTYEKPNHDGLSVTLLLPQSQNQHVPSSFPALSTTQYSSGHSVSQGYAPVASHQSLGVNSHSAGGSLSLGSSYSVSPTVNTFSPLSFGGGSYSPSVQSSNSFGSGVSSSYSSGVQSSNSFGSGVSSSFGSGSSSGNSFGSGVSHGSGSSFSGVLAAPAPSFVPSPVAPVAQVAPVASFAPVANTLVQKHIYVHVPPPDDEELNAKNNAVAPVQAQKHYKIIFIKAPSGPSVAQQLAQAQLAQQQSEEKTLVYVLVKKPESLEELQNTIARTPVQQPSKPEVYFIKYKAQQEQSSLPVQSGSAEASLPISPAYSAPSFVPLAPSATAQTLELPQSSSFSSTSSEFASSAVDSTASTFASSSSVDDSSSKSSLASISIIRRSCVFEFKLLITIKMKLFVVLSCIALAVAKPQGYSYNQPSSGISVSSGSAPSYSTAGSSGSFSGLSGLSSATYSAPAPQYSAPAQQATFSAAPAQQATYSAPAPQATYSAPAQQATYSAPAQQATYSAPAQQATYSAPAQQATFSAAPAASQATFGSELSSGSSSFSGLSSGSSSFSGLSSGLSGLSSSTFGASAAPAAPQAETIAVHKHIYVHVPPPQEEDFAAEPRSVAPVQAQKHYKIIFIKAPSAPSVNVAQLQQLTQPKTEEKTIVYVLSKKQQSLSEVAQNIQPAPTTPSKPEVYFIKYKTQKEQAVAAAPAAASATSAESSFSGLSAGSSGFSGLSSGSSTFGSSSGLSSGSSTFGSSSGLSSGSSTFGSSSGSSTFGSSSGSSTFGSSLSSGSSTFGSSSPAFSSSVDTESVEVSAPSAPVSAPISAPAAASSQYLPPQPAHQPAQTYGPAH